MDVFHAAVLGLIQGLTEFLPVSSSGHLVLFQNLFGITEATRTFDVLLHIATLIGVFIVYWKDIWALIQKPFQRTTYLLIAATLPTVIIALVAGDLIDNVFAGGKILGFSFIITGCVLMYADSKRPGRKKVINMSYFDALVIGALQGIAICPAISRSGMTISGALSRNLNREAAAKFSFLMSIPAILGAMVLELKDMFTGEAEVITETIGILPMAVGFLTAAISGYLAIRFMLGIIRRGKLRYFAFYVFILGAFVIVDQNFTHFVFKVVAA